MLEFLSAKGFDPKYIGGRTQYFLNTCPFCDKIWHCGVNLDTKTFGCFKCHSGGNFVKLLQAILKKNFIEVLEYLKTGAGEVIDIRYIDKLIKEIAPYQGIEEQIKPIALPEGYTSLYNKRIPYLDSGRKFPIPQDQVNYYKMGVCSEGHYKNRLVVCDVNEKQEPIYWVARDISGKVSKKDKLWNPNSEELSVGSSDILFNYYLARNYPTVVITEGVFDSIYVGNNAVATYGTGLKKNHMYWLLQGGFKEAVLLYDSDVKDAELEKSGVLLSQFFNTRICKLPSNDPDDWPKDKLNSLIQSCERFEPTKLLKVKLELC